MQIESEFDETKYVGIILAWSTQWDHFEQDLELV